MSTEDWGAVRARLEKVLAESAEVVNILPDRTPQWDIIDDIRAALEFMAAMQDEQTKLARKLQDYIGMWKEAEVRLREANENVPLLQSRALAAEAKVKELQALLQSQLALPTTDYIEQLKLRLARCVGALAGIMPGLGCHWSQMPEGMSMAAIEEARAALAATDYIEQFPARGGAMNRPTRELLDWIENERDPSSDVPSTLAARVRRVLAIFAEPGVYGDEEALARVWRALEGEDAGGGLTTTQRREEIG